MFKEGETQMNAGSCALLKFSKPAVTLAIAATLLVGCAGGSLTTREKGAGIGALGGAAAGGIIGSAVRHPAAGAAIGAAIGLGAGALIGDQLQARENEAYDQDQQVYENQLELERQRRQLEELRRRREY